jgi:hypothetical protein
MGAAELARLEKTLLARGLSPVELERARRTAKEMQGSVASALVARRAVSEDELCDALADTFRLPKWDGRIDADAARALGEAYCWEKHVVPVERRGNRLTIAVSDPTNLDLHTEVRFASGARVIDVVVALDAGLARALRSVFPMKLTEEQLAHLPAFQPVPGDDWETTLRMLREISDQQGQPSPPQRITNALLVSIARGDVWAVQLALGARPGILGKTGEGAWSPIPWIDALKLSDRFIHEMAAHCALMAGLAVGFAPDSAALGTITDVTWHGGRGAWLDVAVERNLDGPVMVVSEAIVRPLARADSADHSARQAALVRARRAIDSERFADAHRELATAMECAVRADGAVGYCAMSVLWTRASLLADEGRFDEAAQSYAEAAACADVPPYYRAWSHLHAAGFRKLLSQPIHAAGHARAALELGNELFGPGGELTARAAFELGHAQLATGSLAEAQQLSASLSGWALTLSGVTEVRARWLEGLLRAGQADWPGAEAKLRAALSKLEMDVGAEWLIPSLLLDLVDAVRAQKGDGLALLERASEMAQRFPVCDPVRQRAEAELARAKGAVG